MNKKIAQNWYYVVGAIIVLLLVVQYSGVLQSDIQEDKDTAPTTEEIQAIQDKAEVELADAESYNATATIDTTGYETTASGLMYKAVSQGTGTEYPTPSSQVTVHYTGTLADGTVFDSSVERGEPSTFGLNQVIQGWTEGLQLMNTGDTYDFIIPSDLAYGPSSGGHPLGGKALLFRVELLAIN